MGSSAYPDQIAAARAWLLARDPFFGPLSLALTFRRDDSVGTAGVTERGVILYNLAYMTDREVGDVAVTLAHEALHFALGHAAEMMRIPPRGRFIFNLAADAVVNSWLRAAGFPVGEGRVLPETLEDLTGRVFPRDLYLEMTAREVYNVLVSLIRADQGGDGETGDGEDKGLGSSLARAAAAGGADDLAPEGDPSDAGEAEERGREALFRAAAAAAQAQADQHGRGRGSLPGWLTDHLGLSPRRVRVPWRRALAKAVRGRAEYSWASPDEEEMSRGIVLPGREAPPTTVAAIIDSSGSVTPDLAAQFLRAVRGLAAMPGVRVLATAIADAAVVATYRGVPNLTDLPGRGGTDFRPALDWAAGLRPRPDVVIYLTDGDGANYETQPPALRRVVWVLTPDGSEQPWGEHIRMEA